MLHLNIYFAMEKMSIWPYFLAKLQFPIYVLTKASFFFGVVLGQEMQPFEFDLAFDTFGPKETSILALSCQIFDKKKNLQYLKPIKPFHLLEIIVLIFHDNLGKTVLKVIFVYFLFPCFLKTNRANPLKEIWSI